MLWVQRTQLLALAHLEIVKVESRSHGASHQCKRFPIRHMRCKPAARPDDGLRNLSGFQVGSQRDSRVLSVSVDHVHDERRTGIKVPNLIRPQSVKGGKVFLIEQKIDRCRNSARSGELRW